MGCVILLCLRFPGYIPHGANEQLQPMKICIPLDDAILRTALSVLKDALHNNFFSSFMAIAGSVLLFHYEAIQEIQDQCPILLCFSKESGTG